MVRAVHGTELSCARVERCQQRDSIPEALDVSEPEGRSILNPYSRLTSDLTTNILAKRVKQEEVKAMCHDMRRFERMAEEKRRSKTEPKIDLIVNEPEGIAVTPETKPKEGQIKTIS